MSETAPGVIVAPDGTPATIPTVILDSADVAVLKQYKKFLRKYGLREALYCNHCWDGQREDGCEAYVTDSQVLIKCRCRIRFFQGLAV